MPLIQGRVGKGSRHTAQACHRVSNPICSIAKGTYGFCTAPGIRCVSCVWRPGAVRWPSFSGEPGASWLWESDPFPPPRPYRSAGVSPKFSSTFPRRSF